MEVDLPHIRKGEMYPASDCGPFLPGEANVGYTLQFELESPKPGDTFEKSELEWRMTCLEFFGVLIGVAFTSEDSICAKLLTGPSNTLIKLHTHISRRTGNDKLQSHTYDWRELSSGNATEYSLSELIKGPSKQSIPQTSNGSDKGSGVDFDRSSSVNISFYLSLPVQSLRGKVQPIMTEMDLSSRFGPCFPRFCHHGFSPLLRVYNDVFPSELDYSFFEFELRGLGPQGIDISPRKTFTGDDSTDPTPSKRSKPAGGTGPSFSAETIKIGIPTSLISQFNLQDTIQSLKNLHLPTSSILGYIITLLGGVLHMSYPPTLEEINLYSHVIYLHHRYKTAGGEVWFALRMVVDSMILALDSLDFDSQIIVKAIHSIWLDCERNEPLLKVLAPLLKNAENLTSLTGLLGSHISDSPKLFVDIASAVLSHTKSSSQVGVHHPTSQDDLPSFFAAMSRFCPVQCEVIHTRRPPGDSSVSKANKAQEIFENDGTRLRTSSSSNAANSNSLDYQATNKIVHAGGDIISPKDIVVSDNSSALRESGAYYIEIASSLRSSGETVAKPRPILAEVLYCIWPELLRSRSCGPATSSCGTIMLPLSDMSISMIIYTMYSFLMRTDGQCGTFFEGDTGSSIAKEILENWKSLGLCSKITENDPLLGPLGIEVETTIPWAESFVKNAWLAVHGKNTV